VRQVSHCGLHRLRDGGLTRGGNGSVAGRNELLTLMCHSWRMSHYIRPRIGGATVFFTVNLADRGSRLLTDEIDRLREAVTVTRAERWFGIAAWVVLPDHVHAVWQLPEGDRDFATRWRLIKSRFSQGLAGGRLRQSHMARQERGIWQRRFWEHHCRDEADVAAHVRYCWINPVKHGLVERPEDWPYSSVHRDIKAGRYGV
jgi:putative transposase